MANELQGMTVAFLCNTEGTEQVELVRPWEAVEAAGATPQLVSVKTGEIQAFNHLDKGDTFRVDQTVDEADPAQFDALMLPGGVANPDQLRMNDKAVAFARHFFEAGKPVGAICHAPWTLVEAGVLPGRTLTSWPSLQTDIRNAGATWVDEEFVADGNLVSSRGPNDLDTFCKGLVDHYASARAAA